MKKRMIYDHYICLLLATLIIEKMMNLLTRIPFDGFFFFPMNNIGSKGAGMSSPESKTLARNWVGSFRKAYFSRTRMIHPLKSSEILWEQSTKGEEEEERGGGGGTLWAWFWLLMKLGRGRSIFLAAKKILPDFRTFSIDVNL